MPASYPATKNGRPTIPFKPQAHAFLPASIPATTNGRPTFALKTQAHVPGDHEWSPYIRKPLGRAITLVRGVSKLTVL
jgi:hypothetical protein